MDAKSIIYTLKKISDNGKNSVYSIGYGSVIKNKIRFFDGLDENSEEILKKLPLPQEVIEILKFSNGLHLFEDEFEGIALGGAVCLIYSAEEIIESYHRICTITSEVNLIPILRLRDLGEICIDIDKYKKGENYLTYPGMEMDKYFKCSYLKWLEYFIITSGNNFWEWNY